MPVGVVQDLARSTSFGRSPRVLPESCYRRRSLPRPRSASLAAIASPAPHRCGGETTRRRMSVQPLWQLISFESSSTRIVVLISSSPRTLDRNRYSSSVDLAQEGRFPSAACDFSGICRLPCAFECVIALALRSDATVATQANFVIDNHRRQRMIAVGISGFALLLSLAPRNERSLFITQGDIKAFSAAIPNDGGRFFPISYLVGGSPSYFASPRSSRPAFGPAAAAPPGVIAPEPGFAGSGGPDDSPAAASSNSLPADSSGGGSGFPFTPPGIGGAPTSPAASVGQPGTTTGGTTTGGTGTTTGGTTTGGTTGGIVPAVPEPKTWSMLIVGFLFAGAALRRRQFSVSSPRLSETEPS
jgi:hypothetical protein